MIYAPITTPAELHRALPSLLDSEEEAATLLQQLQKTPGDTYCDILLGSASIYRSEYEAFCELYEGSIDDFQREKCEDYALSFSNYTDFYADWLAENYECYWLGKNKILIIE